MQVEKLARPCILERKAYVPGKPVEEVQRELGICDIIKMASNENPLGTSPLALEAMIRELRESAHRYPESCCHRLACRLAQIHGLTNEHFFLDNGADGVITMLGLTFINPGEEVIYSQLSFPAYEHITAKMDGVCVPVPLTTDYRLDVEGFIAALTPRTKLVFLCNPNNPTGTIITQAEFERLLEAIPEDVLLVSDEAYYEFADHPAYPQTRPYLDAHPNLIILRTFSKVMGLAGLRIGYAMAHPDVIGVMLKSREPFPVNRIAQAGALAALDDEEFVARTLAVNRQGREQFYAAFEALGLCYYPTQTNFIFVDLEQPVDPLFAALLREGVIVRPLTPQGVPTALRITIGTPEENARTIEALTRLLVEG